MCVLPQGVKLGKRGETSQKEWGKKRDERNEKAGEGEEDE
jgi:hypothetical protein